MHRLRWRDDRAGSARSGFRGLDDYARCDSAPATWMANDSRVNSSITVRHFSCCPLALAEWHQRVLQWQVSRRVLVDGVVSQSSRCNDRDRELASALQRGQATFQPREPDANAIQTAA